MSFLELRDTNTARAFLLQGLLLQRALPPDEETTRSILFWAMEFASAGDPLPPLGVLADIGHLIFERDRTETVAHLSSQQARTVPDGITPQLLTLYEDSVLGRLYADNAFERGRGAICRYQGERDRSRGLAFVLNQIQLRTNFSGVMLSPGVIKSLTQVHPRELLQEAWDSTEHGVMELLPELYEQLIDRVRQTGDLLGPEDVLELERGTVLKEFGQRLAMRQVSRASTEFLRLLPAQPVHKLSRHHDVPTHILDEDAYPVGGFTSISNRGSVESLLHSQLAFMDPGEGPDLFDMKFLRDELMYYSRDENQFLRRRRSFLFVLYPELTQTRTKDPTLRWQRIVLIVALLFAAVQKLTEWLSEDALAFEFVFIKAPKKKGKNQRAESPLKDEQELLDMLFREQIANGTVTVTKMTKKQLPEHCESLARRSLCHTLTVSPKDVSLELQTALLTRLQVKSALPLIGFDKEEPALCLNEEDLAEDLDAWQATLVMLLRAWM